VKEVEISLPAAVPGEEVEERQHVHVELTSEQLQRLIDAILPEVMSVEQLGRYLQKGRGWISQMARRGQIPAFKMGNSWRFLKKAVDEWLLARLPSVMGDKSGGQSNK